MHGTMALAEIRPGEGTRGRILEELVIAPRTAKDLALTIGIQESAARGHLERLEQRGFVTPVFTKEGVGRPRKRFSLTSAGQELFPRRYEMLLDAVMDEMVAKEGEAYVSTIFAAAARRMAQEVAREVGTKGPRAKRAQALADALNELGFRCTVEKTPIGEFRIIRHNCVFRSSALTHAYLLCEVFDKNLTQELLGQTGLSGVSLEDSITRGSLQCSHLIQLR
ncbi:MAG: ArsR family transcriptional regulator [Thermoplasmata archaeon]|nr:ArsR family transcriptional regulator [Thermoplasmata archaeon]